MTKIAVTLLVVVACLYIVAGATMYALQRNFVYVPSHENPDPASVGLPEAQVEHLKARDGEMIVSWFVRGPSPYIAIYLHGNAGAMVDRIDRIQELHGLGLSVLAIDYRGFGASTGKPSEPGLNLDADAAYDRALSLGFMPNRIMLFGESLGTGVSLELATRREVAGVMLDSPYSSIVDIGADRYWLLPVRWLMTDQFRSDLWIARVRVPIFMANGTADTIVPIVYGRRLRAHGGDNVTAIEVPEAGHLVFDQPSVIAAVRDWLKRFGI